MIVVSNTTPLCYLALIGHAEVLRKLYGSIRISQTILAELRHADAPPAVRDWVSKSPEWLNTEPDPSELDESLAALDPGERTALLLAEHLHAKLVLLDDSPARALAQQRGLRISGTFGILRFAAQTGLLSLHPALDLLRKTNFRASPQLWRTAYGR